MLVYVEVPLSKGKVSLVDVDDAERVLSKKWYTVLKGSNWYAYRKSGLYSLNGTTYLHNFISGYHRTDHINGNALDNRKINLRESTKSQNAHNTRKYKGTSKFKGVYFRHDTKRWQSKIKNNNKSISLGCYSNEIDAAIAYDEAARKYHGEFACVNFPKFGEQHALRLPYDSISKLIES